MSTGCSSALSRFQDAFAQALLMPGHASVAIAALTAQPGFAVYRNTVMKGCIDALQANYPAVVRLVGEEWFRAAAAVYARGTLPSEPMLLQYGADFADFLAHFEPAAGLPYLPDVARLDRCWTEAHCARSVKALDRATLACRPGELLGDAVLHVHPATRWRWFADAPIFTIWSRNRDDSPWDPDFDWRGEGALITRPRDTVLWSALDAGGCALLDACARGATLSAAADAALQAAPDADLAISMARLIEMGAFRDAPQNDAHAIPESSS